MDLTSKLKESGFDYVHHSQRVFRSLMMALAFPGKIQKIDSTALAFNNNNYHSITQCLLTLLDLETSIHIISNNEEIKNQLYHYLEINTGCLKNTVDKADFILCLEDHTQGLYPQMKKGNLKQPNLSASIFYLVEWIDLEAVDNSHKIILRGPGIQTHQNVFLKGISLKEIYTWQL